MENKLTAFIVVDITDGIDGLIDMIRNRNFDKYLYMSPFDVTKFATGKDEIDKIRLQEAMQKEYNIERNGANEDLLI